MIHLSQIRKSYQRGSTTTEVLRGVDLNVTQGECVILAGPSGSGKSTLLSILGCMLTPDSGTVSLLGTELNALTNKERTQLRRDRIGFVFQRFQLIRGLTTEQNITVPLTLQGFTATEAKDYGLVDDILTKPPGEEDKDVD